MPHSLDYRRECVINCWHAVNGDDYENKVYSTSNFESFEALPWSYIANIASNVYPVI